MNSSSIKTTLFSKVFVWRQLDILFSRYRYSLLILYYIVFANILITLTFGNVSLICSSTWLTMFMHRTHRPILMKAFHVYHICKHSVIITVFFWWHESKAINKQKETYFQNFSWLKYYVFKLCMIMRFIAHIDYCV